MWYLVLSRSLPDQEENKQLHYEEHRQWLDDQHRAGRLLFSGRPPIARTESILCERRVRAKRNALQLKTRTILEAFESWKS
jgi:uncharacterized protein YciI